MQKYVRIVQIIIVILLIVVLGSPQKVEAVFIYNCQSAPNDDPCAPTPPPPTPEPVHQCPSSDTITSNGLLQVCSASADVNWNIPKGGKGILTEADLSQFPPIPGGGNQDLNYGVTLDALDANGDPINVFYEICFPDPSGFKVIYHWISSEDFLEWYGSAEEGRWVVSSSYSNGDGMTCTKAWVAGTYAIH